MDREWSQKQATFLSTSSSVQNLRDGTAFQDKEGKNKSCEWGGGPQVFTILYFIQFCMHEIMVIILKI